MKSAPSVVFLKVAAVFRA